MNRSISSVVPVSSYTNEFSVASIVRAPKAAASRMRFDPVIALADDLHEAQLALHRIAREREIDDPVHWHEPLELALDLLDDAVGAGGHDGDARDMRLVLRLGDRQALDVVAAARNRPAMRARTPGSLSTTTASVWRLMGSTRVGWVMGVHLRMVLEFPDAQAALR